MRLISERVRGFRNIKETVFEPSPQVNVICGENGQGKTNLLESIFLLSGAKSFRSSRDKELIRRDAEGFSVLEAQIFAQERQQSIRLTVSEKGRTASRNKAAERRASELAGTFCCVVFSPEHLELVKGTPAQRRRFLDTALCQLSARYYAHLRDYSRLLLQKNTLLKDARGISAAYELLDIYDGSLAAAAAAITAARRAFTAQLQILAGEAYGEVSGGREKLTLSYCSTLAGEGIDEKEILRVLSGARAEDLRAGFSTLGPHRDDLSISLDGESARAFGSQGQQRTAVLALKLGEAQLFREKLEEEPVLLLDDVLSELDGARQEFLLKRLGQTQAIITCCEPDFIERRTDAEVFEMKAGVLGKR